MAKSETKKAEVCEIGSCKGCKKRGQLREGVCAACLDSPNRGKKWADLAGRIHEDPELAIRVFGQMKTPKAKKVFLFLFSKSLEANGVDLSLLRAQIERAS